MTHCSVPKFRERFKVESRNTTQQEKRIFPMSVKERDNCLYIQKNRYCVNWKATRKNLLVNEVEVEAIFEDNKNKLNEDNFSRRNCYQFPKSERIDQLDNIFVFISETHNDQEFAEAYAAGLYNVNCL